MANVLSHVKSGDLITAALLNSIIDRVNGVAVAPSGVSVPSLFGYTLGQAVSMLQSSTSSVQLGGVLDVYGTATSPTDPTKIGLTVVSQSPSAGLLVPSGTGINLVIAAAVSGGPSKAPTITSLIPSSPTVGLTLQIVGTNFDTAFSNDVVTIGGIQATVQSTTNNNGQTLFVTVPTGADKVAQPASVIVTTPSGGASNALTATIQASTGVQPPTITSFSGTAVQVLGTTALVNASSTGTDITVSGTGFGTDASKVQMFLGNPATAGVPSLTPTSGTAVTATTMTIHVPPSSQIAGASLVSTPILVVNGVQGPPSTFTLRIS
jgi:hypothetical protein